MQEAFSGSGRPSVVDIYSPPEAELGFYNQNSPKLFRNKEDFRQHVRSIPWDLKLTESVLVGIDAQLAWNEHLRLMQSPMFKGEGVPHGNGGKVLILEGYRSAEWFYTDPVIFFNNIDYDAKAFPLREGTNIEPMRRMIEDVVDYVVKNGPMDVIAHSRSALMLAILLRKYADVLKDKINKAVCVGGPIPYWVNSLVASSYLHDQDRFDADDFEMIEDVGPVEYPIEFDDHFSVLSIVNPDDSIIRGLPAGTFDCWRFIRRISHIGMLNQGSILREIAFDFAQQDK